MPAASEAVVVNTGPLIALGACGQLELLHQLHTSVIMPEAVAEEFGSFPAAGAIPDWLDVQPLPRPPDALLRAELDDGEAAVIALAVALGQLRVVLDERLGRRIARLYGLPVTGSVGLLLRAKRAGLLVAIQPCLAAMRANGVWLSDHLIEMLLHEAGER